jgi:hypothetical protein
MADCPPGWNVQRFYCSKVYLGFHAAVFIAEVFIAEVFLAMPLQQVIARIMQTLPFSQHERKGAAFQ